MTGAWKFTLSRLNKNKNNLIFILTDRKMGNKKKSKIKERRSAEQSRHMSPRT